MIRKILRSGDPKLREKSKPVAKIDGKILEIIKDLKDTLESKKDPEGIGLAAPQIGKNLRIFIISFKGFEKVVINPEIISKTPSKKETEILEGCLSLPNYYGPLNRNQSIKIKYRNEAGKEVMEEFKDFHAQIIMHEIDHLNGVLFLDRLLEQKKPLYKFEGEKFEEVEI